MPRKASAGVKHAASSPIKVTACLRMWHPLAPCVTLLAGSSKACPRSADVTLKPSMAAQGGKSPQKKKQRHQHGHSTKVMPCSQHRLLLQPHSLEESHKIRLRFFWL